MQRFLLWGFAIAFTAGMADAAYSSCIEPYPPSMVATFNRDCGKDPKFVKFCSCVIDTVQKTIPLAEFIEAGSKPGGINADPRYNAATRDCLQKYQ